jgi:hypothetical protein
VSVAGVVSCRNHPEREALGICVRCQGRFCAECVTKVDGINYCVGCLAALVQADRRGAPAGAQRSALGLPAAWALALSGGVLLTIATWGLVEAALRG